MKNRFVQSAIDLLFSPLRLVLLSDRQARCVGLTSLEDERVAAVLPHIEGHLLDIGAGNNRLVREYGNGIGVDVYDWGGGAIVVDNTARLPFQDEEFDTVTFVACLNHIPYREAALREAYRVLREGGTCLVTMIGPWLGWLGHKIWWYSEEKERGTAEGETAGLASSAVRRLAEDAGFVLREHSRFLYALNNLYEFSKPDAGCNERSRVSHEGIA